MRHRRLVMALLGIGVIGGYGSGIAHLVCARRGHGQHRQQMMQDMARACVDASRAAGAQAANTPPERGPWHPHGRGPWHGHGHGPQHFGPPGPR